MDKYGYIDAIINTLNTITVSGRENLNSLLGSIQGLEKLGAILRAEDEKNQKEPKEAPEIGAE